MYFKFSLVNHDSFQMLGQINYIYTDKIEIYTKIVAFIRKFGSSLTGIVLEMSSADSMMMHRSGGFAYELASSFLGTQFTQGADVYPLVFTYPARLGKEAIEKHMKPIIGGYLNSDLDQKVKYFFEPVSNLIRVRFQQFITVKVLFFFLEYEELVLSG